MKVTDPALTPGHFLKATDLSAAEQLQISAMSVSHRELRLAAQLAQKKALEALRLQLSRAFQPGAAAIPLVAKTDKRTKSAAIKTRLVSVIRRRVA